jgi:hypothetical protein
MLDKNGDCSTMIKRGRRERRRKGVNGIAVPVVTYLVKHFLSAGRNRKVFSVCFLIPFYLKAVAIH